MRREEKEKGGGDGVNGEREGRQKGRERGRKEEARRKGGERRDKGGREKAEKGEAGGRTRLPVRLYMIICLFYLSSSSMGLIRKI